MHRRAIWRLSRRVDVSSSTTSPSPNPSYPRTFRSSAVRLNTSESGGGNGDDAGPSPSAGTPKFGNRWASRQTAKPTGLSPSEQALRDSLVASSRPASTPEASKRSGPAWGNRQVARPTGLSQAEQALRDSLMSRNRAAAAPEARTGFSRQQKPPGSRLNRNHTPRSTDHSPENFSRSTRTNAGSQHERQHRLHRPSRRTDWHCQSCDLNVFARHDSCPSCKSPRPESPREEPKERRAGDWKCHECDAIVFGWRKSCVQCGAPKPASQTLRNPSGKRDHAGATKLKDLGQSILAETEKDKPFSRQMRHTESKSSQEQEQTAKSDKPEKKGKKEKKEVEKGKDANAEQKDEWAWDMSALKDLETLEAQQNESEQKKPKRRDGRKQRASQPEEGDFDPEERNRRREERKRKKNRGSKEAETAPAPLYLPEFISVSNLADVIGVRQAQFVARMEEMGFEDVTYNHVLDAETAGLVAAEYNYEAIFDTGAEDLSAAPELEDSSSLPTRPPVVTIMGHVDHGKTTILDWLRKSSVAATEHGGITQHIGAFSVAMPSGKMITFLDTPGHSAFLEMRRRGADVTDIVVLVVAADDSVKPQTIEAIKHAMQADVPIIVAISKIDKEGRNPDRVKQDLSVHGVHVEDYGGDVQAIPVSGKTGEGMLELEEAIGALSEMLDHRADRTCNAEGWVIEATTKSYGRVASALIRRGTLRPGDVIVAGQTWARVRTLRNEAGVAISEATPGMPVEIDGWREQPVAGAEILQAPNEQKAKDVVAYRQERSETQKMGEDMVAINEARRELLEKRKLEESDSEEPTSAKSEPSGPKAVNFIIKADVNGSAEAVLNSIAAIGNNEVYANVLRSGVGPVTEFDIEHAASASGRIISFNTPIEANIIRMAELEGVKIMDHNIIYKLIDDVKDVLSEQLAPTVTHRVTGEAEVGQIFEITVKGRDKIAIAGCRVRNGLINKTRKVRVIRGNETIYDGTITSLKNVKKDVTEMRKDTECGIGFEDWTDFAVGDHVQCYEEIFEKRHL
ncbi:Translation initiation factor IF-2 [Penicillium macrosclerotiorum]|uniref:Translation initiation factor IF-2 n=1 Tax=Penicillium macrosclerotiorum TaxID=303699 RepID=UPI002548E96C|nr:Translation initiation factor IF-2 [Penicillium macrosclerotiorum]KAJ5679075.1 Translation initiation factor IF-2 [Penicillium macrosclerotiorum]